MVKGTDRPNQTNLNLVRDLTKGADFREKVRGLPLVKFRIEELRALELDEWHCTSANESKRQTKAIMRRVKYIIVDGFSGKLEAQ